MAETQIGYSVLDCESKKNRKDSDTSNKRPDKGRSSITVKKSTVYVLVIAATLVLSCNGICMYLIASRTPDCTMVGPVGYNLSASKIITKDMLSTGSSGCPPSWLPYGQSCYFISRESTTWLDAMIQCIKIGGYLVEINSAAEDQYLQTQAKKVSGRECFNETSDKYDGLISTSYEGRTCQRWDSQFPHKHSRNNITRFPESSLVDAANYCRDPDGEGVPWCYTTDSSVRWQLCGIHKCPGNFWIGMSDQIKGSSWTWITSGTPITYRSYKNWANGEPSNKKAGFEHCGSLTAARGLAWSDENCFNPELYICEN